MNLIRIIAIALVIWLIYRALRNQAEKIQRRERKTRPRVANVVKCDLCGVHVPEAEAVKSHGRVFCSQQHRDAAERQ
jgi:uncharacterized protein